jgi:hypothetical protein
LILSIWFEIFLIATRFGYLLQIFVIEQTLYTVQINACMHTHTQVTSHMTCTPFTHRTHLTFDTQATHTHTHINTRHTKHWTQKAHTCTHTYKHIAHTHTNTQHTHIQTHSTHTHLIFDLFTFPVFNRSKSLKVEPNHSVILSDETFSTLNQNDEMVLWLVFA